MKLPQDSHAHAPHGPAPLPEDAPIAVRGLSKTYRRTLRRARVDAVTGIDLTVHRGEVFGFLGHNGAGKSTTIKMLIGLVRASAGTARVAGAAPGSVRARASIGYLPENPAIDGTWTPDEFLTLSSRLAGLGDLERRREIGDLVDRLGISSLRSRPMRKLSKGQVQLVGLAHAFLGRPPILILDEPMSGLDPAARRVVRELVAERRDDGASVFLCSHILADVERLCDRIALVASGRLVGVYGVEDVRRAASAARRVTIAAPASATAAVGAALPPGARWQDAGGGCLSATVSAGDINRVVGAAIAAGFELVTVDDRGDGFERFVLDRLATSDPGAAPSPQTSAVAPEPLGVDSRHVSGGPR